MPDREKLIDFIEKLPENIGIGLADSCCVFIHGTRNKIIEIVKDRYMDYFVWDFKYKEDKTKIGIIVCDEYGMNIFVSREEIKKAPAENKASKSIGKQRS